MGASNIWITHIWVTHIWDSHIWDTHIWASHIWVTHIWESHIWVTHIWASHLLIYGSQIDVKRSQGELPGDGWLFCGCSAAATCLIHPAWSVKNERATLSWLHHAQVWQILGRSLRATLIYLTWTATLSLVLIPVFHHCLMTSIHTEGLSRYRDAALGWWRVVCGTIKIQYSRRCSLKYAVFYRSGERTQLWFKVCLSSLFKVLIFEAWRLGAGYFNVSYQVPGTNDRRWFAQPE